MREHWVRKHLENGLPMPKLALISGFHENTLYSWEQRYMKSGLNGLKDASRAPLSHPNEYSDELKDKIRQLRSEGLKLEKRYLGPKVIAWRLEKRYGIKVSPSGIGKFLNRAGLVTESGQRRRSKKDRVKKCHVHEPGELIQLDVKYAVKSYSGHWFFEYGAIDYITGIVYAQIYELQSNLESILFLKSIAEKAPFRLKGVQTDNGSVFTNYYTGYKKSDDPSNPRRHCFDLLCGELNINHYLIDPGKPAQNGKIERFHRTVEEEFYQTTAFKDLNSLRKKLRDYLYYYNHERENQALAGLTPIQKLRTFLKYETIKEIIN